MLCAGTLNSVICIRWGGTSSTDGAYSVGPLGVSISVGKIARFRGVIISCCIDKRDLVDDTISCKILTISCTYALKLLVLRLQARYNSLHRSLKDIIRVVALANFCLSTPENINLSILQGHFDIAKSVYAAL